MVILATASCQREPAPAAPAASTPAAPSVFDPSDVRETGEDLRVLFEERRDDMDPEARETVDENLSLIDRSIGELVSAVESDPENPKLHSLLLRAYQSQVRLLQRAVTLAKGGSRTPAESTVPEKS